MHIALCESSRKVFWRGLVLRGDALAAGLAEAQELARKRLGCRSPRKLEQIRAKYADLASKPIAKVAEARARKKRHAALKLKTATKKAEALANEPDMSEKQKLKAIEKAMKAGSKTVERPGRTYVVAKAFDKGKKRKGAGKVTLVDKRLKCDKRSMKRSAKKREKGSKYKRQG